MVWKDQVGVLADENLRFLPQMTRYGFVFFAQDFKIDHHPGRQDRGASWVEHTRWEEMNSELLPPIDHGVSSIRPTVEPHDHIALFGQEMGDFALALISPLHPKNGGCHFVAPY
jgi:hypothetical protein